MFPRIIRPKFPAIPIVALLGASIIGEGSSREIAYRNAHIRNDIINVSDDPLADHSEASSSAATITVGIGLVTAI